MGDFETHVYDGERWRTDVPVGRDWLRIEVHDSDIAIVTFSPAGAAQGTLYLGYQPRDYFDDPGASVEIDVDVESSALAAWARRHGAQPDPTTVRRLAAEIGQEPDDDFVEDTVDRLLDALGIPAP